MKFRWKLMIITMLIVSFSFGFGGMLLIQYSYQVSIKQEKRAARNSYEMILRMLKEINEMDDTYQNQTFASVLKRLNWQERFNGSSHFITIVKMIILGEAMVFQRNREKR